MTEFVSDIKKIAHPNKMVFDVLSDLSKLELLKDRLPSDKITEFTCDQDSCSFSVAPVGRVKFVVVDREPNKTIKFRRILFSKNRRENLDRNSCLLKSMFGYSLFQKLKMTLV